MLLSEARPRPYRTNYEERRGKFAPSSSPGYNDDRKLDYEKMLSPDSAYRLYTDKKDREIDWFNALAFRTVNEYNWKHPMKYCGRTISLGYFTDYYSAGFKDRFVYLYVYDSIPIKIDSDSYMALEKSKLFRTGSIDVTDNLFPELKEIGDKVEVSVSYDVKSQSMYIRYEIHIGRMDEIDVNTNATARAEQLDKLVHRTLDKVSISEIVNRIIKLITKMLAAVKSGGEIQNAVE